MPSIGFAVGVVPGIGMSLFEAGSFAFGIEGMPGISCFPVVSFIPGIGGMDTSGLAEESLTTGIA
jgi:hypothetical protein